MTIAQRAAQLLPSPRAPKHAISRAIPVATANANCHAVSLSWQSSSAGGDDGDVDADGAAGLIAVLGGRIPPAQELPIGGQPDAGTLRTATDLKHVSQDLFVKRLLVLSHPRPRTEQITLSLPVPAPTIP